MLIITILAIVILFTIFSNIHKSAKENKYLTERRLEAEEYFAKQKSDELNRKNEYEEYIKSLDEKYTGPGIIECELAGLFYRTKAAKEEVREYLKFGHELSLRLDKKNQYDKFAVKVFYNGKHIGFIPMEYSKQVHDFIILNFGYIVICTANNECYNSVFDDEENIVELKLYPKTENN